MKPHIEDKDPNDFFELNDVFSNITFKNSDNTLGLQSNLRNTNYSLAFFKTISKQAPR